ncbi:MAG: hypothetical protein RIT45_4238 [Pseudomonadota bacterium]|jgi:hypothetical protein
MLDQPAVLPLRQHDPLPPLGMRTPERAQWRLLLSVDAADLAQTRDALDALRVAQPSLGVVLLPRGDGAEAITDVAEAEILVDPEGRLADRLGALADSQGRRAALWVLVEPRGTVQASAAGLTAWEAATAPLRKA